MKKIKNLLTVLGLFTYLPFFAWAVDDNDDNIKKNEPTIFELESALSGELLLAIFEYLDIPSLLQLSQVSHYMREIVLLNILKPRALLAMPDAVLDTNINERFLWAAANGHLSCLLYLALVEGANINVHNNLGQTPLCLAILNRDIDMVRFLLDHGAAINLRYNGGTTALHAAALWANWNINIVKLLLDRGEDINAQDNGGTTALHAAAFFGDIEMVRLLLRRDANANVQDNMGMTALYLAASNHLMNIVELLLDSGANANAQDNEGRTALDTARDNQRQEITNLLERTIWPDNMRLRVERVRGFIRDHQGGLAILAAAAMIYLLLNSGICNLL